MRVVLLAAVTWALAASAMAQKYDFTVRPERTPTQAIVVPHEEFDGPQIKLRPRYLEEGGEWFRPPGSSPNEKIIGGSITYRPYRDDTEVEMTFLRQFGSDPSSSYQDRLLPREKEKKAIFSVKKRF